jgi:quercetin dioxygenase-like cupin family protein
LVHLRIACPGEVDPIALSHARDRPIFIPQSQGQTSASGFPKGDLSSSKNHTGNIWLSELNMGDSTFDPSIAIATYDAGAKLDWHIHPGGRVLLITEGTGYYQDVHEGDVIKCAPGVDHWHGATPNDSFAYIAGYTDCKGQDDLAGARHR